MALTRPPRPAPAYEELERGEVDQRRVFGVRSDRVRSVATGKALTVDRLITPDWVNVIAFTDQDELLCVRQFRFGSRALSLEIPAGIVDPGEDARAAALRELREETGHAPAPGSEVHFLGETLPNPAFMDNKLSTFFVPRAVHVGELQPDEFEELEVVTIPRAEVRVHLRDGRMSSALVLVAFLRLSLHGVELQQAVEERPVSALTALGLLNVRVPVRVPGPGRSFGPGADPSAPA